MQEKEGINNLTIEGLHWRHLFHQEPATWRGCLSREHYETEINHLLDLNSSGFNSDSLIFLSHECTSLCHPDQMYTGCSLWSIPISPTFNCTLSFHFLSIVSSNIPEEPPSYWEKLYLAINLILTQWSTNISRVFKKLFSSHFYAPEFNVKETHKSKPGRGVS